MLSEERNVSVVKDPHLNPLREERHQPFSMHVQLPRQNRHGRVYQGY